MITDYAQMSVKLSTLLANEQTKQAINTALSKYPLYKGKKQYDLIPTREQLNEKILDHYKHREIGFETVGRFLDELRITMCEIMPYYNELFKSVEIMADLENPFDNVDVTETFEEYREDNGTSNGQTTTSTTSTTTNTGQTETNNTQTNDVTTTGSASSTMKNKFSDTPQNHVDNINNYLSEYREETGTSSTSETVDGETGFEGLTKTNDTSSGSVQGSATNSATTGSTGSTRHTYTKKGNQGVNTYAHDMNEFRTSIIDVVDRIIHDNRIAELFMLVW